MKAKWFITFVIVAMLLAVAAPVVKAAPPEPGPDDPSFASNTDDVAHPLGTAQREVKADILEAKLNGQSDGDIQAQQISRKNYVEMSRLGEDKIWTLLTEFGTLEHSSYPGGLPGPLHNQIPEPNRAVDNSTIWTADFNTAYYQNMLFSDDLNAVSMRNYYLEQSSNRYTVTGVVEDWAQLPYNAARYGRNFCGDIVCSNTWRVMQDGTKAWYEKQLATKTPDEIDAYLSQFDVWDRYDYDHDGNFNEPDGYIDHFEAVHAGEGEETGGGALGTDAIWSHRGYAELTAVGAGGPTVNGKVVPLGGVQVGSSKYWIGDYTIEPENGGVGVFAHEFGHDLGLPDLYDTSGNTGGADNSTGFWTLYSSGSYGSSGQPADALGTMPVTMSALEKIMLGWSNYQTVKYNQKAVKINLGPAEYNTQWKQQLVVQLPKKKVTTLLGKPFAGSFFYHSGSGNDLDNTMTRTVTLPAGTVSLSAKVRYDMELDYDYAFLTVNGTPIHTNLSSTTDPNSNNPTTEGITGSSKKAWVNLTADLSAYAGQTVTIGFEYKTDPAVARAGFGVDKIAITGLPSDGAEVKPSRWTFAGFIRTNGIVTKSYSNYYVAEYRQYNGYDNALQTGPYHFGFQDTEPNWVEHYPYQDGLLVWYWDYSFIDNNVGDNCANKRCGGMFLPVDAHPKLFLRPDNHKVWNPEVQSYDSTFGLQKTDKICLHTTSTVVKCYGGLPANPLFNDKLSYWVAPNKITGNLGWSSVPLPGFGVRIRVNSQPTQPGDFMKITVN